MMLFAAKVDAALHPNRFATTPGTQATWGEAGQAMDPSTAEELLEMEEAVVEDALEAIIEDLFEVAVEPGLGAVDKAVEAYIEELIKLAVA